MPARIATMVLLASVLAGCGASAGPGSSSNGGVSSTPRATPEPPGTSRSGPPHAQATLAGDASVSGPVTFTDITCGDPGFSGAQIVANATGAVAGLAIRLTVANGSVRVMLDTGSGTTYAERDFTGTGVSGFDASNGAQISSALTESTAAGGHKGNVAAVTNLTASLSCNGQTPGSGAFTLSGSLEGGALGSTLTATRVVCSSSASGVTTHASGIGTEGSTTAIIGIFAITAQGKTYLSMTVSPQGSSTASYLTSTPGVATVSVSTSSMQVSGGVTEPYAPMHTVQVTGMATCGSSIQAG